MAGFEFVTKIDGFLKRHVCSSPNAVRFRRSNALSTTLVLRGL